MKALAQEAAMTRKSKLECHLAEIIFEDLRGTGISLSGRELIEIMARATQEQKARAYQRSLHRNPSLLEDEIGNGYDQPPAILRSGEPKMKIIKGVTGGAAVIAMDRILAAEVLSMVPDDLLKSEWGRRSSAHRKTRASGNGLWRTHRPEYKCCRCATCEADRVTAKSIGLTLVEYRATKNQPTPDTIG